MPTSVEDATALLVTVNVLEVVPAATSTLTGTVATLTSALDSSTLAPADGAGWARVTVAVEPLPPTTLAGLSVSEATAGTGGGGGGSELEASTVRSAMRKVTG